MGGSRELVTVEVRWGVLGYCGVVGRELGRAGEVDAHGEIEADYSSAETASW